MITQIFLPERLGTYRILSQRYVGVGIAEKQVVTTTVLVKQSKSLIEAVNITPIEQGPEETKQERIGQALKTAFGTIKKYDQIKVALPASLVVFKDLTLNFIDPAKIRMVLEYEIETMLPFSLNEAVVDFIITKVDKVQKQSQILVAAVRSSDLAAYLEIFERCGLQPTTVTVDLFADYSLYQQIPEYENLPHATALVDLQDNATRIAYIQHGQLRLMRYLNRGIDSITKEIAQEAGRPLEEITTTLQTYGVFGHQDEQLSRIIQKHVVLLLNDIQFTLNSFSLKLNFYDGISKILISGAGKRISKFMNFCTDTLQTPCEVFDLEKLFNNKKIKNKTSTPLENTAGMSIALGSALSSPMQMDFDLRRKAFTFQRNGLIIKQAIVGSAMAIILFTIIGVRGYMDIQELENFKDSFIKQEIAKIKAEKIFPKDKFPKKNFAGVIRDAEKIVRDRLETWAPFSKNRLPVLDMLLEITRILNKRQFDASVKEVHILLKDNKRPQVDVEGVFKSRTGDHFQDFIKVEERFKESPLLTVGNQDIETSPAVDGGVNFTARLSLKEE